MSCCELGSTNANASMLPIRWPCIVSRRNLAKSEEGPTVPLFTARSLTDCVSMLFNLWSDLITHSHDPGTREASRFVSDSEPTALSTPFTVPILSKHTRHKCVARATIDTALICAARVLVHRTLLLAAGVSRSWTRVTRDDMSQAITQFCYLYKSQSFGTTTATDLIE